MNNSYRIAAVTVALVMAGWSVQASAQLTRQSLPTQRQASGPLPTSTPAPTLVVAPSVTVDPVVAGGQLLLRTRGMGATANGRRVRMVRVSDGEAQYLDIVTWRDGAVVVSVPARPFGVQPSPEALLVGVCVTNGGWVGIPARTVFALGPHRTGIRPPGCAVPDWDGDGTNARACGGTDCDDGDSRRVPGGIEICDAANVDEDCDVTTHGSRDADGDGRDDMTCCNADSKNGRICGDDCDDYRAGVHRLASEVCDQFDNDCDSAIDEGVKQALWLDRDGDGFGDPAAIQMACGWAPGLSHIGNDCNDADANVYKGHGCD